MKKIFFLIFILVFTTCKTKKKIKEIYDPEWRDKSTQMSAEICNKLYSCFQQRVSSSASFHIKTHVEKNLQSSKCIEKHKKSNVYFLRSPEPDLIKKNFLICYESFQNLTCQEIYSGGILQIPECKWIQDFQKL